MTENAKEITVLRYRIERYQEMGNGAMCQTLRRQLQKKLANGRTTK